MGNANEATRSLKLAIAYFVAEMLFDGAAAWVIVSNGHPWWGLIWIVYAGASCNTNVKRYSAGAVVGVAE